jgi:DNA-binding MarR family transcriptional regulator
MPAPTEDQLAVWKQLQWATALIMGRFRRDLAEVGLSLEQFDVLVHLAWAPSGTLPLHELTASMVVADALSRSGITRLLDRMERDGLISRTVSTIDRRRFDVSLTAPGRRRFEQVWPGHADGIGRYFVQPLAHHDIGELARILGSLIQANQNHASAAAPGASAP